MRRPKTASFEDLMAAADGKWHHLPEGFDLEVVDDNIRVDDGRVVLPLNSEEARVLRPRKGDVLVAKLRGRELEIVRHKRRRPGRGKRRMRA